MADLLLYGSGWNQRWTLDPRQVSDARDQILRAGSEHRGSIAVTDPNTGAVVVMAVNWRLVAVALIVDGGQDESITRSGQYP